MVQKYPFQDLSNYQNAEFSRGKPWFIEAVWIIVAGLFVSSWLPGSAHRRLLLRIFGATIGHRVVIKPGVKVKFPWKLSVGDNSWIGERVWIDNLAPVAIGRNCCISQGAYLCTGSHDHADVGFKLITKEIKVLDGAWIAAKSKLVPGIVVGEGAILGMGSVATKNLEPNMIYFGIPAEPVRARRLR